MPTGSNEPLIIDVVADVVCPWCYIGVRRLKRALARGRVVAEIRWLPFQLDASIPPEGIDRQLYLSQKFGTMSAVQPIFARLMEAGLGEGISFDFDRIKRSPNTFDIHRLIQWAGETSLTLQNEVVERFFAAYFLEGEDLSDTRVVASLAAEAGMDEAAVLARLRSPEGAETLDAILREVRSLGVNSVPMIMINGEYAVRGAQEAEILLEVIDRARAAQKKAAVPA